MSYQSPARKDETCRKWLSGTCNKSHEICTYNHYVPGQQLPGTNQAQQSVGHLSDFSWSDTSSQRGYSAHPGQFQTAQRPESVDSTNPIPEQYRHGPSPANYSCSTYASAVPKYLPASNPSDNALARSSSNATRSNIADPSAFSWRRNAAPLSSTLDNRSKLSGNARAFNPTSTPTQRPQPAVLYTHQDARSNPGPATPARQEPSRSAPASATRPRDPFPPPYTAASASPDPPYQGNDAAAHAVGTGFAKNMGDLFVGSDREAKLAVRNEMMAESRQDDPETVAREFGMGHARGYGRGK